MALLWDADPKNAERFALALGAGVTRVESAQELMRAVGANKGENLAVIGADIELGAACELAEVCRVEKPQLGIILLRHRLDVTALAGALRSGIREVVTTDDLTGLAEAVRRSRDLSARVGGPVVEGAREGKVVTVFSAKGGVGKTTFATNIGAYLASTGYKVLLADLDLAFGDVGISLQLIPHNSIRDLVAMGGGLDEQGLASIVTHHGSGLDVACAPSEPSDADRVPGQTIAEMIKVARRSYDYVIIDTPPAFTEHVLAAFDNSDHLLLIATLDIPAVKNLRITLDTLDLLGNPKESRIVVLNRSNTKVGLSADDVVAAIKTPIAATVPSSIDVPASVNRGVPIVLDDPRHAVSTALRQLTDLHLVGEEDAPTSEEGGPSPTRRGLKEHKRDRWSLSRGGRG
jgi:pilus assembly protein CpaE